MNKNNVDNVFDRTFSEKVHLSQKFINGLEDYELTYEDVKEWLYCGGNYSHHLNYYKLLFPKSKKIPEFTDQCVCHQKLTKNCYIMDKSKKRLLILGMCCIKKFISNGVHRSCEKCGNQHRNRKFNLCNDCKIRKCDICGYKNTNKDIKRCNNCRNGWCDICDKKVNIKYKKCYKHKLS